MEEPTVHIVVLNRGFVLVGEGYWRAGDRAGIEMGATLGEWRTDAGLGQIAHGGPNAGTGPAEQWPQPATEWPVVAEIQLIECNVERWSDAVRRWRDALAD